MNSSLVVDAIVSAYDDALRLAIGFADTLPIDHRSPFLIAIENEFGQTYRLVGVEDLMTLMDVLRRLRRLNYVVKNPHAESIGDVAAIVKVPRLD